MDAEKCCGYAAAFVSIVAFGTFAVPIKSEAARKVSVDPLVLQTYKVGVCFATSWLVLAWGVPFTFTPYGFVSGLLMVPGGTAGYFGVRNAGLALSQGIWSSLKVLVAFAWGIFMFHEPVQSVTATALAVTFMLLGLSGMSYFASSGVATSSLSLPQQNEEESETVETPLLLPGQEEGLNTAVHDTNASGDNAHKTFLGLSARSLGILGAIVDGLYGGSVLVPMHFAKKQQEGLQGLGYLISFGIGCWTVILLVWLARWTVTALMTQSAKQAWQLLPSMHVSTIGPYATLAGLIWSVGNVCSILSVALLGQGLGYSLVQSQLIVAGLWAVCFYGEIEGRAQIGSWFAFAALTVVSILLLTRQHESSLPVEASTAEELF